LIKKIREKYNSEFTNGKYDSFVKGLKKEAGYNIEFRIGETPVFLPAEFKHEILNASEKILEYLHSESFRKSSQNAIPPGMTVPGENNFPQLLALDFALCKEKNDKLIPQLIELQGFPSLYFYQVLLDRKFREYFNIPSGFTNYFNGLDEKRYIELLREVIVGGENPDNVILLEIEPENQKTKVDFIMTERLTGVKPVCITDIIKDGKNLYYIIDSRKIQIKRIYNRVIFDELQRRNDLKLNFSFQDELDVKWIPHPNWFFKISKHTLPSLKNKYVPDTYFLDELKDYPVDLENYVLKPLFSFAGAGVKYEVGKNDLDEIKDKSNYILQKKIQYAEIIETPDVPAKAELRLLFAYKDGKPLLVNNLVRLSKGKMMGVDYNKEKTWVGSSIAYFE
jgi:hypothetical protein